MTVVLFGVPGCTFLDNLDARFQDANGMRGGPWDSIHPKATTFPVSPVLSEYLDQGCYDRNGPVVISKSGQDILHNDNRATCLPAHALHGFGMPEAARASAPAAAERLTLDWYARCSRIAPLPTRWDREPMARLCRKMLNDVRTINGTSCWSPSVVWTRPLAPGKT